jgi:DNA-binding winged helix-turn-helix (wHTH) protein
MDAATCRCLEGSLSFSQVLCKEVRMQVTFGGYRLDFGTRQLFRDETEVRLSPKAFDLLRVLIDNRSRAVSKAELHDRLWPGTFVTEANLAVLVSELRRVLRDRAATPKVVRTVHRFGYAFCGEIAGAIDRSASMGTCWIVWGGREIALHDGENIIGRDPRATVRLDFPSVSRRHARIVVSSEGAIVEDLGSKNGTFLRKDRLTRAASLADLDELEVGSVRLTVRILNSAAPTQTQRDQ